MVEPPVFESVLPEFRINLSGRLGLLGGLLFAEKLILETLVDERHAETARGLGAMTRLAQHWGFRYLVTFLAAVTVLAFVRAQQAPQQREASRRLPELRLSWILAHGLLVSALGLLSYFLYRSDVTPMGFAVMAAVWILVCAAAVVAAGLGFLPSAIWQQEIRSLGTGWGYAAVVALLGTAAWLESEKLWKPATALTFDLVKWLLLPILPMLDMDPATRVIGTDGFAVEITEACSGLEGLGLTLAFSVMWLLYFRREYIFPRALILIPICLVAIFGLNALRIAALLLIGIAGFPDVALYGFHSQAGWIAFNAVACALVFFSRRSIWLNRTAATVGESREVDNPTATYLVPLLAILAAGTVSHALSGRFETFYALRLIAAFAALYLLRHSLLAIRWRFTWRGPAVGGGVYLLWAGVAHWLLPAVPIPEPLAAMLPLQQSLWIASHVLTSVALVPVAEELAYRGYLMRRLTNSDFESVAYASVRRPAVMITAIAFGAAHGTLWLPGIAAGMAYGLLVIRRGSLGEAVAAHATTNGLIAITVLAGHQWQLW